MWKAFDSKKFQALTLSYLIDVAVLALIGLAALGKLQLTPDQLGTVIEVFLVQLGAKTGIHNLAQAFADAKTGGQTSGTAAASYEEAVRAAVREHLQKTEP